MSMHHDVLPFSLAHFLLSLLQSFEPDISIRRAARYYMYRKWVAIKFDNIPLGKGNRVRIPPCVVEAIRDSFREPGCKCALGGPLYACKKHGYTGHREAPLSND
jgi:hypothetical protein